jgi:lipid II:glycine glycyltransferase (peptidoglycan interpeptide bridge formation enzyme)
MEMDISEPLETLLNRMHRHTRQEYRKSQECGVRVRKADGTQISELVRLLSLTSERKRLRAHETGYFSVLLNTYDPENVNLLLAEANGEVIGATLEVTDGRTAYWLYGGFDYGKRHFHPNVALQIEMIRWAQHRGCKYYDLGDACTSWPPLETDKGYGVFRFKTRLGAQAKLCAPYCDFIYRPVLYRLAGLAENIGLPFAMESGKSKILVAVQRLRVNRELV